MQESTSIISDFQYYINLSKNSLMLIMYVYFLHIVFYKYFMAKNPSNQHYANLSCFSYQFAFGNPLIILFLQFLPFPFASKLSCFYTYDRIEDYTWSLLFIVKDRKTKSQSLLVHRDTLVVSTRYHEKPFRRRGFNFVLVSQISNPLLSLIRSSFQRIILFMCISVLNRSYRNNDAFNCYN